MDELVRWLTAYLDEDERIARAATPGPWKLARQRGVEWVSSAEYWAVADCSDADPARENAEHVAAWDPARVLREIDAKRKVIEQYESIGDPPPGEFGPDLSRAELGRVLRLVALPYSDRPGYREEWRP